MKWIYLAAGLLLSGESAIAQIGISSTSITPHASSVLELRSTTTGFLPPRMTTTERNAIASPATGLMVYNTTTSELNIYNGSSWQSTTINLTGDVTSSGAATTIASSAVTNAKMANMAATTFKGNASGVAAAPTDLTATQATAMLNNFSSTLKGLVPLSGGGTVNFLRADGTWAAPAGGSGTVTTVGVTTANGVSGSVSNATTTPAITLSLGAITPTSVAASGTVTGSNLSGTNTGDQTTVTGNAGSATLTAVTDDNATVGTVYPTWVSTASGNQAQKASSTKLSFNPSTGILTSTGFAGNLTGNVTGNAATVTTNANLTGDVTSVGNATSIAANAIVTADIANSNVTNAKLAQMAANTIKGNNTAGLASAADLTAAQVNAMLPAFTSALNGLTPASGGGSTNFLRADGTWAAPPVGSGTVTTVSVTTANGISGSVSNATTTPAITVSLGAITPASVAATGTVTGSNLSGTNTGDQTTITGNAGSASTTAITNDVATAATMYPVWVTANTGNLAPKVSSTKLTFNPSTGMLTSTGFTGNLTGNVTGNATNITGTLAASSFPALTGDITTTAGSLVTNITANAITVADLAQVPSGTILGRDAAGTGNVAALTDLPTDLTGKWTFLGTATGSGVTVGPVTWTGTYQHFMVVYYISGYSGGSAVGRLLFGASSISTTGLTTGSSLTDGTAGITSCPSIPGCPLEIVVTNIARSGWAMVEGQSGALKRFHIQGQNGGSVASPPALFIGTGVFSDLGTNLPLQRMQLSVYDALTGNSLSTKTFTSGTYLTVWGRGND